MYRFFSQLRDWYNIIFSPLIKAIVFLSIVCVVFTNKSMTCAHPMLMRFSLEISQKLFLTLPNFSRFQGLKIIWSAFLNCIIFLRFFLIVKSAVRQLPSYIPTEPFTILELQHQKIHLFSQFRNVMWRILRPKNCKRVGRDVLGSR